MYCVSYVNVDRVSNFNGNHGDVALVAVIFIAVKTLLCYKVRSCCAELPVFGAPWD